MTDIGATLKYRYIYKGRQRLKNRHIDLSRCCGKLQQTTMFLVPTAFVIFCVASVMADSRFDGLDDNQKAMMKMLRDTCLKESGSEEGLILRAMKGDFAEDDKLKAYMACTFQQVGAMDDDGVPDMDTMISMLPDSMQERGGKMIKACKDVTGSSGPDTAMKLNKCFYNTDPEYYFII